MQENSIVTMLDVITLFANWGSLLNFKAHFCIFSFVKLRQNIHYPVINSLISLFLK